MRAIHDDVIKWNHFPRYWPFVQGINWIPSQRPVTRSFDIFFYLRLNKGLSKQSWVWWFETPSRSLWRHCNDTFHYDPWNWIGCDKTNNRSSWRLFHGHFHKTNCLYSFIVQSTVSTSGIHKRILMSSALGINAFQLWPIHLFWKVICHFWWMHWGW